MLRVTKRALPSAGSHPRPSWYATPVLVGGLGLILLSVLWLIVTGNTNIRYSADHAGTIPVWTVWIPSLIGLVVIRLSPPSIPEETTAATTKGGLLATQVWTLLGLALLFPAVLALAGDPQAGYAVIKLAVLVAAPLAVFWLTQGASQFVRFRRAAQRAKLGKWYWLGPILPLLTWFYLTYATPLAMPPAAYQWPDVATLVVTMLFVFLINAVVEEVFYRVWLQSRLELVVGRWAAIVLASVVWAVWHIVIQGGRGPTIDLATVVSNQGVQGLFLGYLWSRYGNLWALLLVHGAINAARILIALW